MKENKGNHHRGGGFYTVNVILITIKFGEVFL